MKKFLAILPFFLFAPTAFAANFAWMGGTGANVFNTATRIYVPESVDTNNGWPPTSSDCTVMPYSGTITKFSAYAQTATAPGSYDVQLMYNEASSTFDVNPNSTTIVSSSGSLSFSAGDRICVATTPLNSPNPSFVSWTIEGNTTGNDTLLGFISNGSLSATLTSFYNLLGLGAQTTENTAVENLLPESGTLKNFFTNGNGTPAVGTSWTDGIREGAIGSIGNTPIICSRTNGSGATCSDTSHTQSVTALDLVDGSSTPVGTPVNGRVISDGLDFQPSTSGDLFYYFNSGSNTQAQNNTRYLPISGQQVSPRVAEASSTVAAPSTGITFTGMSVYATAPAAGQTRTYTLRDNSANTALVCTLTSAGQTTTCTGSVTANSGDLLDIQAVNSATSGTASFIIITLTGHIPAAASGGGINQPLVLWGDWVLSTL